MPTNSHKELPLELFYELLTESVKNMLVVLESKDDYKIAFEPLKKQIEMFIAAIEEKKEDEVRKN